ncbi:hypothetical protein [Streptomyces sp. NPDC049879]|uniref:hypothetical protein n=1 Tax=Streptomyces sp. NPDC049879 TaxID=3365598 RepID=UPI0037A268C0
MTFYAMPPTWWVWWWITLSAVLLALMRRSRLGMSLDARLAWSRQEGLRTSAALSVLCRKPLTW